MPRENRLWILTLERFQPEEIEWAFNQYLTKSHFFPKPADILEMIQSKRVAEHVKRQEQETNQLMEECREIREKLKVAGEPYGLELYRSIMAQALAKIGNLPALSVNESLRQNLRERMKRAKLQREQLSAGK